MNIKDITTIILSKEFWGKAVDILIDHASVETKLMQRAVVQEDPSRPLNRTPKF